MKPIFGALASIFIIFFNKIETVDSSSQDAKEEARRVRAHVRRLKEMKRTEAANKAEEGANSFSEMPIKTGFIDPSSEENQDARAYQNYLKGIKRAKAADAQAGEEAKLFSEMLKKKGITEPSLKIKEKARVSPKYQTEAYKKDIEDTKAFSDMLKRVKVNEPSKKKEKESRDFSQMLHRLQITNPSFSLAEENTERTYGTSRATQRQLMPRLKHQQAPKSEPNLRRTRDDSNRLPTFEHAQDRSGQPHVGGNFLPSYEKTVSQMPGDMYIDSQGYYQQVPPHPSPSTGNYIFDHLHQFNSAIPPSGSSYSQSTQNYGHDHSFQSSGVAPSNWPFSDPRSTQAYGQGLQDHQPSSYSSSTHNYGHNHLLQSSDAILPNGTFSFSPSTQNQNDELFLQSFGINLPSMPPFAPALPQNHDQNHFLRGFQDNQSYNYHSSESPGNNQLNEYQRNQYPPHSGGSGSGHGSSYPYNK